jgi:hypothetical protein
LRGHESDRAKILAAAVPRAAVNPDYCWKFARGFLRRIDIKTQRLLADLGVFDARSTLIVFGKRETQPEVEANATVTIKSLKSKNFMR